jgi:hypothetical protein
MLCALPTMLRTDDSAELNGVETAKNGLNSFAND